MNQATPTGTPGTGPARLLDVVPMDCGDSVELGLRGDSVPDNLLTHAGRHFFEFPTGDRKGGFYIGTRKLDARQFDECLAKKTLSAYRDESSGMLRMFYKELCIRFHAHSTRSDRQGLLARHGLEITDTSAHRPGVVYARPSGAHFDRAALLQQLAVIADDPCVALATPNFVTEVRRCGKRLPPSIPARHWHLRKIGIQAAWAVATGNGVTIAVIDDGLDLDHPSFRNRIALSEQFNFSPREAGDDLRSASPRAVGKTALPGQREPNDYHGTACAGVAAAGRDGMVRGVAPDATILPIKIIRGLSMAAEADLADALKYAEGIGARVLSCSWFYARGPVGERTQVDDAIEHVTQRGAVVVCAAGDDDRNWVNEPAANADSLAVGACSRETTLAPNSNFGSKICVYAPSRDAAGGILTTDCTGPLTGYNPGAPQSGDVEGQTYDGFGGTSAAAAITSGVVALMLQANSDLGAQDVCRIVRETGTKMKQGAGGGEPSVDRRLIHAGRAVAAAKAMRAGRRR